MALGSANYLSNFTSICIALGYTTQFFICKLTHILKLIFTNWHTEKKTLPPASRSKQLLVSSDDDVFIEDMLNDSPL